jgi:hypothetical protein
MTERRFVPNPEYGKGAFWRRIRITVIPNVVVVELEDNSHAMRCRLKYSQGVIVDTDAEMLRVPMNTCGDAGSQLKDLIGLGVDTPYQAFYGGGRAALNCTHLYDIAWLAVEYASSKIETIQYDVAIPDMVDRPTPVEVRLSDQLIHEWLVQDDHVVAPRKLANVSLTKGFIRWALTNLDGGELVAALVLHKGYLVARARKYIIDSSSPSPATDQLRRNACFGFSAQRVRRAKRLGSRIELKGPEGLLSFPPPAWS